MTTEDLTLDAASERASAWLFDTAMPLWLEHGVDWTHGGFYESLSLTDLAPAVDFKRLRVLTRQIYVFSQGALHGVPRAHSALSHGLAFLLNQARHPQGGFASRQDREGNITDPTRDLYDLAFVLFSLAHAFKATGEERLKDEAILLLAFIRSEMRHPAGGYVEALPRRTPRRQNPHMHLLEAGLACLEHMPHPAFAALVEELTLLCRQAFLNTGRDRLFEYFEDDLAAPLRPDGRALIEPGHHLEWAWLFAEVQRVTGAAEDGEALARFALSSGLDRHTGFLRGVLYEDGAIADPVVRLWPHCEWLKAALRVDGVRGTWAAAWRAVERFLDVPTPGVWREQWDPSFGGFLGTPAPASTLYHVTTAIMELRRAAHPPIRHFE
jgi:mannose/cellobiose epimerase-like protein (N-acyl-D-glucosamine 2-epimerase family)